MLIIGMYADHNLASAEDKRVEEVLDTFNFSSDYERDRFSDSAFTRARKHSGSPETIRQYLTEIAGHFSNSESRRRAYDILEDLLTSDGNVSSDESKLLSATKEVFQL